MNKYYLSTTKERTVGIAFSLIMSAVLIYLLFVLRNNLTVLLLSAVCVVLVVGILLLYVLNVSKAACIPVPDQQLLRVTGVRERTIDLSTAVQLETIPVKSGQVESRSLAFTDAEGKVVAIIPTYFTSKRGVESEPMAKELAQALNVHFKANVPAWEYDEEARKIHDEEVARQEKENNKARREARKAARVAKIRKKMQENNNEK
jgi:hypothetical protein